MKKFLTIIAIFFLSSGIALASDLSLHTEDSVEKNQLFSLDLVVNTGGESINSVDIGISYPKDLVQFKGYKEESGVVKIWLKQPSLDNSGIIQLSGIIPGGVDGLYNPNISGLGTLTIARLLFEAKSSGRGDFKIDHSTILLNDGHGSPLIHDDINTAITVTDMSSSGSDKVSLDASQDMNPPEPFTVSYFSSSYFSKTPPMLIFNAVDNETGIEKYELKKGDEWTPVTSPLQVKRALLSKEVTVRAVDFSGNSRESTVTIPGLLSLWTFIFIIVLLLTFLYSRSRWYKTR